MLRLKDVSDSEHQIKGATGVTAVTDGGVLDPSRSSKVCMTCHWFRHHAGAECIPVLTCHLHRGQIAQGEHLIRRCQGWTDDMVRQRGWAPEVG